MYMNESVFCRTSKYIDSYDTSQLKGVLGVNLATKGRYKLEVIPTVIVGVKSIPDGYNIMRIYDMFIKNTRVYVFANRISYGQSTGFNFQIGFLNTDNLLTHLFYSIDRASNVRIEGIFSNPPYVNIKHDISVGGEIPGFDCVIIVDLIVRGNLINVIKQEEEYVEQW